MIEMTKVVEAFLLLNEYLPINDKMADKEMETCLHALGIKVSIKYQRWLYNLGLKSYRIRPELRGLPASKCYKGKP